MSQEQITYFLVAQSDLEEIKATIQEIKCLIQDRNREDYENQWIESADARRLLGVSPKTWQTYRDERVIPFSQFGRKIYFKRADIEAFLEAHTVGESLGHIIGVNKKIKQTPVCGDCAHFKDAKCLVKRTDTPYFGVICEDFKEKAIPTK